MLDVVSGGDRRDRLHQEVVIDLLLGGGFHVLDEVAEVISSEEVAGESFGAAGGVSERGGGESEDNSRRSRSVPAGGGKR